MNEMVRRIYEDAHLAWLEFNSQHTTANRSPKELFIWGYIYAEEKNNAKINETRSDGAVSGTGM